MEALCVSSKAKELKLNNIPTNKQIIDNLRLVANRILEPLYAHYKILPKVTSGYRRLEVNRAIGSKDNSQHVVGMAVDFSIPGVNNKELALWIQKKLIFDQVILEFNNSQGVGGWVHVSYSSNHNRQVALTINANGVRSGIC
ncbi:MAG: D-Ala-D-Ala carboxypeptidase family metallohydrolase [Chroococcidiopsis sp.]